jgi:hypothetical protein
MHASSSAPAKPFETATVVSVRRQEMAEPPYYGGDNPSDAQLRSEIYTYDVTVRTRCGTYVTRYESPYDYFPTAIHSNTQIPVRVGKHDIAFNLEYRQMQMPIAHRSRDNRSNCP